MNRRAVAFCFATARTRLSSALIRSAIERPGLEQRLDDVLDLRGGGELAGDDLLGAPAEAPDFLAEHDAEGLQKSADLVLDPSSDADQDIAR